MKKSTIVANIFLRYTIIILAGIGNLFIFYKLLTLPTVKLVGFLLNIFSPAQIVANTIFFKGEHIFIIPACVAGSAFYLLFILLLSTPNIKTKKRIYILFSSFISLFILNVLRIVFLSLIVGVKYFQIIHMVFWYGLSTIFVVGIWISAHFIFKLKAIPFCTDIKYLYSLSKKNSKKSKRAN